MTDINKIVLHWTAGGHTPSNLDKEHYHFIVAGDGTVVPGKWPVEANRKPVKGKYAAHTLNCNTGSIGVAVAAMAGAQERPFDAGRAPITPAQLKALAALCRDLATKYRIPVTRETILSHAEVQPTLGIRQRGKWDIAWLPGMKAPGDPVAVGDKLRAMIAGAPQVKKTAKTEHDAGNVLTPSKRPAQAQKAAPPSSIKETGKAAAGGLLGGGVVLAVVALWDGITTALGKLADFYHYLTPWN